MMASIGGFDMGFGPIPSNVAAAFGTIAMDGDEYVRCTRCGFGGCDVRVSGCGCTLHTRCCPLDNSGPLQVCPQCEKPTHGLVLFPMSFREIDEAHRTACALPPSKNRGRKRKSGSGSDLIEEKGTYVSERRTGRWTNEEMTYCDKLMSKFATGELPVADGVKLNEFLGNMLKSKQSRLTKKMKNAKLSSKVFQRTVGCLQIVEAREFSELEESFFQAVQDHLERAEIKFHMQKEWREQFSRVCATIGQPLDADAWLSSVEEMDRRASQAKDAARMAKRKLMMGVALRTDCRNTERGVFIEKTPSESRVAESTDERNAAKDVEDDVLSMLAEEKPLSQSVDVNGKSSLLHSAPFLAKTTAYLERHAVPFEHIDLWVPSFVPGSDGDQSACRLCYAGSATVDKVVEADGKPSRDLTSDERFNFFAFGDYSQKFSFDTGCGLPGRVYESGRPTWEQSVHNAPHNHFERCGGALQWGIKTVVGIPIASPNVGRIVVTLYSTFDRPRDEELVSRLSEEFTRLMPSPKWKLVVDIGDVEENLTATPVATSTATDTTSAFDHSQLETKEAAVPVDSSSVASAAGSTSGASVGGASTVGSSPATGSTAANVASVPAQASAAAPVPTKDPRIEQVVSLLGEYMPSDPTSTLAPYLQGFMSLRLLLLRPSRSSEEDDLARTMLDSYSSYGAGGRARADIAVMLARDFMFLNQQQIQQQAQFQGMAAHGMGPGMMATSASHVSGNPGLSVFGLPSTSSSLQNSPALIPIQVQRNNSNADSMSVVSN